MYTYTYTIIIPHKNTPDLLIRNLNSIPDRNDIQVIVVDDNSDIKLDEFKFDKTKISYIYLRESGGAGRARNAGLNKAQGKWLLFSDSDDFFTENAFDIFDIHSSDEANLVYFRTISKDSVTLAPSFRNTYILNILDDYKKEPSEYMKNIVKYRIVGPVAKMYKKEIIDRYNIVFDEVMASNDVMFSIKSAYYSGDAIKILEDVVYCMTTREGSLTQTFSFSIFQCRYNVTLSVNNFLKRHELKKYRFNIIRYILKSVKYGVDKPFILLYSAIKAKENIFINCFSQYR